MATGRRWPRYHVSQLPLLQGEFDRTVKDPKLVTLGYGGCGFYHIDPMIPLAPIRKVISSFRWGDEIAVSDVQGKLIYARELEISGKKIFYYGVEFLDAFRDKVKDIVDKLELCAKEGSVPFDPADP